MRKIEQLDQILAAKAEKGKYLFQTEQAVLPYPFPLTNAQRDTFEKLRGEIKAWLRHREMFIEVVHQRGAIRNARAKALERFEEKNPKYTREAIDFNLYQITMTMSNHAFATLEHEVFGDRERFMGTEPSGISLGFLSEDDALEFRLRWL